MMLITVALIAIMFILLFQHLHYRAIRKERLINMDERIGTAKMLAEWHKAWAKDVMHRYEQPLKVAKYLRREE